MTHLDDRTRLIHMLRHAEEAVQLVVGRTRTDLDSDRLLNLALVRLMEIVGEAATRVSEALRLAHPSVPWKQIGGLRHRLIHGYDSVDFDILWDILQFDLPPLILDQRSLLSSLPP